MSAQHDEAAAKRIINDGQLEDHALKAKKLLEEFTTWNARAMAFVQETGNPPQDPLNFLRNVVLTYGMKKLENKIITIN
jgi:hypothetical protein